MVNNIFTCIINSNTINKPEKEELVHPSLGIRTNKQDFRIILTFGAGGLQVLLGISPLQELFF
jgi:hypothetical protein